MWTRKMLSNIRIEAIQETNDIGLLTIKTKPKMRGLQQEEKRSPAIFIYSSTQKIMRTCLSDNLRQTMSIEYYRLIS